MIWYAPVQMTPEEREERINFLANEVCWHILLRMALGCFEPDDLKVGSAGRQELADVMQAWADVACPA